ncbi:MAG TPA: acetylxylan esterase [archaeon]|nr:acetylxylan esterase [archaeon]
MNKFILCAVLCLCAIGILPPLQAQNENFEALQSHFERVVTARFDTLFNRIDNVGQWEARKEQTRQALYRMLWHDRRWPESPPGVRITHIVKKPDYMVECLVLETSPGLYATANLYLPRNDRKPFPVILYQCGHANKRIFKHHGAWFAARGIAVLMMDNIEMGEIEFTHHGVYANAWFHWYSRGFSPMAVELLNARRTLDYLCTREELDSGRIGATGVSGGGMATFFLAAIDERVKASAPVSGAISTVGWVKHQLSSAHCDCQYPVNSYGLLYSEIGALTAPRAQLLCNAESDRGFPMDAFNEMVDKMREVYSLYHAEDSLRTAVVPGGHGDHAIIRLPVYSFFLKEFLGIDTSFTQEGPVDTLPSGELACWQEGFPLDERLTRIDEELIPAYPFSLEQISGQSRESRIKELTRQLGSEVFRYFPSEDSPFEPDWREERVLQGRTVRKVSFISFEDMRVRGIYSIPEGLKPEIRLPAVLVIDHRRGIPVWGNEQPLEGCRWGERVVLLVETLDRGSRALEENLRSFRDDDPLHHMKRQAMVSGTTIESMQLYEVLRSVEFLKTLPEVDPARITIVGKGESGINGLYTALLDRTVEKVILCSPPASHRQGPCYLNILRFTDIPEVVLLMKDRVGVYGEIPLDLRLLLAKKGLDKTVIAQSLKDFFR